MKNCVYFVTYDFIFDFYFIFNLKKICEMNSVKRLNLLDCFKFYFSLETKQFTCQNVICKKINNNSHIFNKICLIPKYLIIILNRGKNDYFDCHVDFDDKLDIKEFVEQNGNEKNITEYKLIGATFLIGKSGAGHTIAFCRHFDNKYYIFNDSQYYLEKLETFRNSKAFILIYERKNN